MRYPIWVINSKRSSSGSALISGDAGPPETPVHLARMLGGREEQLWRKHFLESISYSILDPKHSDDFSLNHFKTSSHLLNQTSGDTRQPLCVLLFTRAVVSGETNALEYFSYFMFSESRLWNTNPVTQPYPSHCVPPHSKAPSHSHAGKKWLLVAPRYLACTVRSNSLWWRSWMRNTQVCPGQMLWITGTKLPGHSYDKGRWERILRAHPKSSLWVSLKSRAGKN